MNVYTVTFLIILSIWLILAGSLSLPVILAGLVVTYFGLRAFGGRGVVIAGAPRVSDLGYRIVTALIFVPVFLWEIFSSAISVSRLVYQRNPRMSPGVVSVRTILTSKTAITILANLITLTPGTLTMDFDSRERCYYVHWIDVTTLDEDERAEVLIKKMEEYLRRILE